MVKKCSLGVDIGTASVKVLAAQIEAKDNILLIGSGVVPSAGFSKGQLMDAEALAKAIQGAISCAGLVTGAAVEAVFLGIGGLEMLSVSGLGSVAVHDGLITEADIDRVCRAAVVLVTPDDHQVLHVLPRKFWVDGTLYDDAPLGKLGERLEVDVCVVSILSSVVDEITHALSRQGIEVAGVVANAVSQAYVAAERVHPCLVVDIGAGISDVVLTSQGKTYLAASIPMGGDYVTNDIMQGLGVNRNHAEEIKRYYAKVSSKLVKQDTVLDCNSDGTTDKMVTYGFLEKVIESRTEEIMQIAHQYLQPMLANYEVETVVLTGGSSLLPSFIKHAEKVFGVKAEVAELNGVLPAEYACPENTACYGILRQFSGEILTNKEDRQGILSIICEKVKRLF
ncbi:MAG: cell division protein FtsA [Firmicutes bacterium]|nr:cell division protein FtsA [Bacillota bacterium]